MQNLTYLSVVTETWPPEVNGVANTCRQLVEGLRQRGDYHVQLVRPRQHKADQPKTEAGFDEYLVWGASLPFYREVRVGFPHFFALRKLWKQRRPDMVQIITEGPLGYAAMRAAKSLSIPVISDFHTNFDQYSQYYHASGFFMLAKRYLRHMHNETLITLVPTVQLRRQLEKSGYKKLGILARGIDTRLFNPARRSVALRESLGVRSDQLLVVLVTRMAQEKNLDLAVDAFRALQEHVPDARFLWVGDGPERARIEEQNPDFIFAGMQRGEALAAHYASGDLFIYPSLSETFGNVVTEAMACGLPVVTFNYAAAYEYMHTEQNGLAVSVDDSNAFVNACVRLAQDKALRQRLGAEAAKTAATLSWTQVVDKLHQTIQTILRDVQEGGSDALVTSVKSS